jgi:hypothetical protein
MEAVMRAIRSAVLSLNQYEMEDLALIVALCTVAWLGFVS